MNRFPFLRYILQFIVVLLPLFTGAVSLLDLLGVQPDSVGNVAIGHWGFMVGPKPTIEFHIRLLVSGLLFGLSIMIEWANVGLPLKRLRAFRQNYLDRQYADEWKALLGDGHRLNVMFLRRPFYFLWLVPVFEWTWNRNFEPPNHRDARLFLTKWQGLAGQAVREEKGKSVYFGEEVPRPRALRGPYYLLPFQPGKTAHLRGILSIPILRKISSSPDSFRCVGVINIDALTADAAKKLKDNEKVLFDYFLEFGLILGDLSL